MCSVYPKIKPKPPVQGLRIEADKRYKHMGLIIHDASGAPLPGTWIASEIDEALQRFHDLSIDWTASLEDLRKQLAEKFTFNGFDWSEYQLYCIGTNQGIHEWKTYEEYPPEQREYLLVHQAGSAAIVGMFIHSRYG